MGNKEDLQEMLDKLSEDELSALGDLISKASNKPRNRRRGRGKSKRKRKNNSQSSTANKNSFLDDVTLSPDEQKELNEASKFDKKKGLDKPKIGGTILQSPKFQKASIKCMGCGKSFEISPALIPPEQDRYKCNSCICRGRDRS